MLCLNSKGSGGCCSFMGGKRFYLFFCYYVILWLFPMLLLKDGTIFVSPRWSYISFTRTLSSRYLNSSLVFRMVSVAKVSSMTIILHSTISSSQLHHWLSVLSPNKTCITRFVKNHLSTIQKDSSKMLNSWNSTRRHTMLGSRVWFSTKGTLLFG